MGGGEGGYNRVPFSLALLSLTSLDSFKGLMATFERQWGNGTGVVQGVPEDFTAVKDVGFPITPPLGDSTHV